LKQREHHRFVSPLLLVLALCVSCLNPGCFANEPDIGLRQQHPEWAIPLTVEGVPNLHKVSEELYRGAQPTAEGMQALQALDIKTIVSFRSIHSDRDEIGDLDLAYERIPMMAFASSESDVVRFLKIITAPERTPVFIHCLHGADRTGVITAAYRIVIQGWAKEAAIQEMTEGGFGYHSIFQNLVGFLENLDVEKIRKEVGIEAEKAPAAQ
jgi:protein tyrosine/serine phosphatase